MQSMNDIWDAIILVGGSLFLLEWMRNMSRNDED